MKLKTYKDAHFYNVDKLSDGSIKLVETVKDVHELTTDDDLRKLYLLIFGDDEDPEDEKLYIRSISAPRVVEFHGGVWLPEANRDEAIKLLISRNETDIEWENKTRAKCINQYAMAIESLMKML